MDLDSVDHADILEELANQGIETTPKKFSFGVTCGTSVPDTTKWVIYLKMVKNTF